MGLGPRRIGLGAAAAITLAACAYIVAAMGSGGTGVARGFIGVEEFGAWRLICIKGPDGLLEGSGTGQPGKANACRVNQEVTLAAVTAGQVVIAINLSLVGVRRIPTLMVRLPATAQAGDSIALRLDDREVKAMVRDCAVGQCIAAGNLSAQEWAALLAAKTVQVRFPAAGGQMVLVDLKLDGFPAAITAMLRAQSA